MEYTGDRTDAHLTPRTEVHDASIEEMCENDRHMWATSLPGATREVVDQLVERRHALLTTGQRVSFLVVRGGDDGGIVSRADPYADAASGVAQIENVATEEEYRGRGTQTDDVRANVYPARRAVPGPHRPYDMRAGLC